MEVLVQHLSYLLVLLSIEDVGDDQAVLGLHLHRGGLVLLVGLVQQFASLVQEPKVVVQHVPRFNAEDEVVSSFSSQGLRHRCCISLHEEQVRRILGRDRKALCSRNLTSTRVNTQGLFGIEVVRQELEAIALATADVKHSQTLKVLEPRGHQSGFVVELQLEYIAPE